LVALENAISSVLRAKRRVILAGPLPRPHEIFERARLTEKYSGLHVAQDIEAALLLAKELAPCGPDAPAAAPPSLAAR
jgi:SulP family sulfate permease